MERQSVALARSGWVGSGSFWPVRSRLDLEGWSMLNFSALLILGMNRLL
ncbi:MULTISPECIES: hypothetical protein [Cyanophyceae]|uniref:Uncharacterized protein n=1 Tax=Leptolyngbya subtilissima DQ-A4 TaxID=2933933 RepID=A0ABV0KBU4_9CYAN|nr:hypothetical protein [Nodosilinea sp. FACHB-141]MBD2115046.1 hypothetical protein [Nodosilinea sp. FACHB-141]